MKQNTSPISSNEKKTKTSNETKIAFKKRPLAQNHQSSPKYVENQASTKIEHSEKHAGVSSSSVSQREFSSPSHYPFMTKPTTPAKNTSSKALYYDNERQTKREK